MPPTAASSWSAGCPSTCTRRRWRPRWGAQVDYVDTDENRLAAAQKLGVAVHDRPEPDKPGTPTRSPCTPPRTRRVLAATLRATWPDGVCTDTGIYYQAVEMPLLPMARGVRFVTGRVNARAVIPDVLPELLAGVCDLSPAVEASWLRRTPRRCGPR